MLVLLLTLGLKSWTVTQLHIWAMQQIPVPVASQGLFGPLIICGLGSLETNTTALDSVTSEVCSPFAGSGPSQALPVLDGLHSTLTLVKQTFRAQLLNCLGLQNCFTLSFCGCCHSRICLESLCKAIWRGLGKSLSESLPLPVAPLYWQNHRQLRCQGSLDCILFICDHVCRPCSSSDI